MQLFGAALELHYFKTRGAIRFNEEEVALSPLMKLWGARTESACDSGSACYLTVKEVRKIAGEFSEGQTGTGAYKEALESLLNSVDSLAADLASLRHAAQSASMARKSGSSGIVQTAAMISAYSRVGADIESIYQEGVCLSPYISKRNAEDGCATNPTYQQWLTVTTGLGRAYVDMSQRNYTAALSETVGLLGCAASLPSSNKEKEWSAQVNACNGVFGKNGAGMPVLQTLGLAAELASAKSPSDAKSTLERWDTTLGRYDMKSDGSAFSVGAFFGAQYGRETLKTSALSRAGKFYGLYIPVGVGYSHPSI